LNFVQLKNLRDLLMFVASSPSSGVIQHIEHGGSHVYFIVGGTLRELFIYLVKEAKPLGGGFVTYNSYTGVIGASDNVLHEPNVSSFPVVDIVRQDLIPSDLLSKVDEL